MRRNTFYLGASKAKLGFKDFFSRHKVLIILFIIVIIIGLVSGIFTAIKSSSDISSSNITDNLLVKFLKGDSTVFGYFMTRFIFSALFVFLIIILSLWIFFIPLPILFLAYKSFVLGANSVVLIVLFGVSGVFNVVFVLFPCQLLTIVCYLIATIYSTTCSIDNKRYGYNRQVNKKCLYFLIPIFVICLIEAILINITYNTFIFII